MKNLIKTLYLLILSIFLTSTAVAGGSVANDDLINAITITSVPYTNSVTAIDSDSTGSEAGELSCDSSFYSGTWWYSFTTTVTGTITADALTQNATTINNFSAVNIAI
ncbi:MAG: hypothetical protein L3J83_12110, partial [Proteobacteria bacterium]|nr:hypothetical protein [Pseudomonadota bacterium]